MHGELKVADDGHPGPEHPSGLFCKVNSTVVQPLPLVRHGYLAAAAHQSAGSSPLSQVSRMRTSLQEANMKR